MIDNGTFFDELYKDAPDNLTLTLNILEKNGGKKYLKVQHFRKSDIESFKKSIRESGQRTDTYFNVALMREGITGTKRGEKSDVSFYPGFWGDYDFYNALAHKEKNLFPSDKAVLDHFDRLPLKPSCVSFSGYGLYAYWLFDVGICCDTEEKCLRLANSLAAFGRALQKLALDEGFKIDSVFDPCRMLRAPGTNNFKLENPVESYVLYDNGIRYTLEQIEEFSKSVLKSEKESKKRKTGKVKAKSEKAGSSEADNSDYDYAGIKFMQYLTNVMKNDPEKVKRDFDLMKMMVRTELDGVNFGDAGPYFDSICTICLADVYSSLLLFSDNSIQDTKASAAFDSSAYLGLLLLQNIRKTEKDDSVERAWDFVRGWIASNRLKFGQDSVPCYGSVKSDKVFIVASVLRKAMEDEGFSYSKCMQGFADREYIKSFISNEGKRTYLVQKKIQGVNVRAVCADIVVHPLTEPDEDFNGT